MTEPLDALLEQWIAHFRGPLVGLLASWGADWGAAEELAMDTFAEAWLGRARLRGSPRDSRVVGPWLRGIAANLFRARQRAVRRRRQVPVDERPDLAAPVAADDERICELRAAFAELPGEQQTVLRMFYLDTASTREVAALLQLTNKAVERRLQRARQALRERVERRRTMAQEAIR